VDAELDPSVPVSVACARLIAERSAQAAADARVAPALGLMFGLTPSQRDATTGGVGFAAGGVLDTLPPGQVLAGFAADAVAAGFAGLSDDELVGVVRAWRRLTSWAVAGELAAVADLAARRRKLAGTLGLDAADADAGVEAELACALTLTAHGAQVLAERAQELTRLPATSAALSAGVIDEFRARVIADELSGLDLEHARAIEDRLLRRAGEQTSGQLRARARRAVLAADPAAAGAAAGAGTAARAGRGVGRAVWDRLDRGP
jgi:hypothetical protein